jgi:phenylpropionate dioxygenase-like ring-hydroxylating dioxygenase large terminal subunit
MNLQSKLRIVPDEELTAFGTGPIPAAPYYKPDYFELEREAIFRRTWLQVAHVCELPERGSFVLRPLEIGKTTILIVRGKDDKIRAFHNVCTHRGTELVTQPSGRAGSFTCRYHAWNFGTDGKLRAAPEIERFSLDKSDCALKQVSLDVCAGMIFVNLDRNPRQSLREFLGGMAESLEGRPVAKADHFAEYVYDIDANWKLTYDNFQEHYHIRFIHSRSIGSASLCPENPFGYPAGFTFDGPHRTQRIWYNDAFAPEPVQGTAFGLLGKLAAERGWVDDPDYNIYYNIFPNFFMLGTPTQNFTHTIWPIAADRSRGVIRVWWEGADASASERFGREFAMASLLDVHSEDRAIIESGQRGLASGALEHIHFQSQEAPCRHFINTVDAMVEAYKAEQAATQVLA